MLILVVPRNCLSGLLYCHAYIEEEESSDCRRTGFFTLAVREHASVWGRASIIEDMDGVSSSSSPSSNTNSCVEMRRYSAKSSEAMRRGRGGSVSGLGESGGGDDWRAGYSKDRRRVGATRLCKLPTMGALELRFNVGGGVDCHRQVGLVACGLDGLIGEEGTLTIGIFRIAWLLALSITTSAPGAWSNSSRMRGLGGIILLVMVVAVRHWLDLVGSRFGRSARCMVQRQVVGEDDCMIIARYGMVPYHT